MWAIRQHAFGGPEELHFEEIRDPRPSHDHVRIRVESAGVHLVDTIIRRGEPGPMPLPDLPMIPGREVSGVIDAVGQGTDESWLGRRVVAHLGMASGGYAQLAVARVASLHAIPGSLDADAAVAMIGTGRTTVAILDLAPPSEHDVMLVTAAAGGIGTLLVQHGRHEGATVIAVVGGDRKAALALQLGAQIALDHDQPNWAQEARATLAERPVSIVFDGVGGAVGRAALELLGHGGCFVRYGWSSGAPTALDEPELAHRGLRVARLEPPTNLRPLETRALEAAASGRLVPIVGQRFALKDAADAHRAIETRATIGKTVLRP